MPIVTDLNLGENLSNSLSYVRKLFGDGGRLIILVVLNLIPIVDWIVLGYGARVLRESPGTGDPPKLEKYGELFVDGAKVFFASLIYMLIPLILIGLGIGTLLFREFMGVVIIAAAGDFLMIVAGVILAFFFLLILGAGLGHMIRTGSFGKVFAFKEIFATVERIGWGRYIGWAVVVMLIWLVISAIAGAIPFVGWVISAIISPPMTVFIFRSLGLLYVESVYSGSPASTVSGSGGGFVCGSCGAPLQPPYKFCQSCGAPVQPPQTTGMKLCNTCRASIPATSSFCPVCGARQT